MSEKTKPVFFNNKERSKAPLSPYFLYYHTQYTTERVPLQGLSLFFHRMRAGKNGRNGGWKEKKQPACNIFTLCSDIITEKADGGRPWQRIPR